MGKQLTAIELFAGGGGLALGTEAAGFKHIAVAEWEPNCCRTLRYNQAGTYPFLNGARVIEGDVRDIDWGFVPNELDLLAGGPPCQPFSLGGLARAALDKRDMFPAFTKVLSRLRPRAFLVENVKGLTRASFADYYQYILLRLQHPSVEGRDGETWRQHFERLQHEHTSGLHDESLRYEVSAHVVDAADYGVPQHRNRVFIVGFRSDVCANWSFPKPTHSGAALVAAQQLGEYWNSRGVTVPTNTLAIKPCGDVSLRPWRTLRDALKGLPTPTNTTASLFPGHVYQAGAKPYPGHTGSILDAPSKALKAGVHGVPGGENMIDYGDGSYRYLTAREAARVQGFPDCYQITGSWSEAMRQIGNAVPVELARVVAASIALALHEDDARKEIDAGVERELNELFNSTTVLGAV